MTSDFNELTNKIYSLETSIDLSSLSSDQQKMLSSIKEILSLQYLPPEFIAGLRAGWNKECVLRNLPEAFYL